jgi:hypothetical protein
MGKIEEKNHGRGYGDGSWLQGGVSDHEIAVVECESLQARYVEGSVSIAAEAWFRLVWSDGRICLRRATKMSKNKIGSNPAVVASANKGVFPTLEFMI